MIDENKEEYKVKITYPQRFSFDVCMRITFVGGRN